MLALVLALVLVLALALLLAVTLVFATSHTYSQLIHSICQPANHHFKSHPHPLGVSQTNPLRTKTI